MRKIQKENQENKNLFKNRKFFSLEEEITRLNPHDLIVNYSNKQCIFTKGLYHTLNSKATPLVHLVYLAPKVTIRQFSVQYYK